MTSECINFMYLYHRIYTNLTHFNTLHVSGIGSVALELVVPKMATCCKNKLSWGWKPLWSYSFVWEYLFSGGGEVLPTKRMAMESTQSPVVSNIYTEHFKEVALDMVTYKPLLWLHYVDDTFVV
jgi:hypothetical protein